MWIQNAPHVYIQKVCVCTRIKPTCLHMFEHMWTWCRHSRGRLECPHRGVLDGHTEGGSHAYQKITDVELSLGPRSSPKKRKNLTHFKFENRSRTTCSRFLQPFALPDEAVGKLRRESAVRWFGLSFSLKPKFHERFARQYRYSTRVSPHVAFFKLRSPPAGS